MSWGNPSRSYIKDYRCFCCKNGFVRRSSLEYISRWSPGKIMRLVLSWMTMETHISLEAARFFGAKGSLLRPMLCQGCYERTRRPFQQTVMKGLIKMLLRKLWQLLPTITEIKYLSPISITLKMQQRSTCCKTQALKLLPPIYTGGVIHSFLHPIMHTCGLWQWQWNCWATYRFGMELVWRNWRWV